MIAARDIVTWLDDQHATIEGRLDQLADIIRGHERSLQEARLEAVRLDAQRELVRRGLEYVGALNGKPPE